MKSQGPNQFGNRFGALAREAIENPNVWVEEEIPEGSSGPTNLVAYSIASILCDITQRDGVLYVRYRGNTSQS